MNPSMPLPDYSSGILVKVIASGPAGSGKTYSETVLAKAVNLPEAQGPIPCYLGHARPAVYIGRFVTLEYRPGAIWGCLVGADPVEIARMGKGARDAGRDLGVSLTGVALKDDAGVVDQIEKIASIDITSKTEKALAGGLVPFTDEGVPIAWDDREAFRSADLAARMAKVLEAAEATVARARGPQVPRAGRLSGPLVVLRESNGGRLLGLLS